MPNLSTTKTSTDADEEGGEHIQRGDKRANPLSNKKKQ